MAQMSIFRSAIAFAFFVAVISMASVSARIGSPASAPVSAQIESPASAPVSAQIESPASAPVSAQIESPASAPVSEQVQSPASAPVSVQASESPDLAPAPLTVAGGAFSLPVSVAALCFPAVLSVLVLLKN